MVGSGKAVIPPYSFPSQTIFELGPTLPLTLRPMPYSTAGGLMTTLAVGWGTQEGSGTPGGRLLGLTH